MNIHRNNNYRSVFFILCFSLFAYGSLFAQRSKFSGNSATTTTSYSVSQKKNQLEFVKNGSIEKERAMAVTVENGGRYRSLTSPAVEASLKRAGYNFTLANTENTANMTVAQLQALDSKPFYIAEYFIGSIPKSGKNPYGFTIKIFEPSSGRVIATGSYIGKESFVTENIESLMGEFITRLSSW